MKLFNSDKIANMNMNTTSVATMGLTDSSVDMVTGTPVAEVPTEGGIWDKTKGFVVENKEMVALAAVAGGIAGYMYYQHRREKAAMAALNDAIATLADGVVDNISAATPKQTKAAPMGDVVSEQ